MKGKLLLLLIGSIVLSGCKLGGSASGIVGTVELTETFTGQKLTLDKDGPFVFKKEVSGGAPYKVVAEAIQPPPDYVCNVFNSEGIVRGDISNLRVECGNHLCTAQYDPVCGKAQNNIVCITTPCPNFQYTTFSNECEAAGNQAQISFSGECGSLENIIAFDSPPIKIEEIKADLPFADAKDVRIENDQLLVTAGFSGCDSNHTIILTALPTFAESFPVQVAVSLQHSPVQLCEAYFVKTVTIDLLPLKHRYTDQYQQSSGSISLTGLGKEVIYNF